MENTNVDFLLKFKKNSVSRQPWSKFQITYGQIIKNYAMKIGLSASQADDILQETLIAMTDILPQFEYNPQKGKFRNFLLTIVHRKALAAIRKDKRINEVSLEDRSASRAASNMEDLSPSSLEAEREDYWKECIMDKAMELLLLDRSIKPTSIDIFTDNVVNGLSAKTVAEKYDVKENAVYQVKNRMIKRLQQISEGLMNGNHKKPDINTNE